MIYQFYEPTAEELEQEEERRREVAIKAWKSCDVPARLRREIESGAYERKPVLCRVEEWGGVPAADSWCLLLCGKPGVGKSLAAAYWLWSSAAAIKRWAHVADLMRVGLYGAELEDYWNAGALVLDDVGTEFSDTKGVFAAVFDGFVEKRCARERKTVITTNLDPESFKRRFGERVADRLRLGSVYVASGESMRGRK